MSNKIALEALTELLALKGTEENEWDGVERVIPEMCELARAALAALEAMEAGGWLPISEAPQDGTVYWATDGKTQREENMPEGYAPGRWTFIRGRRFGEWSGASHLGGFKATHYRALPPLPTPPKD